MQGPGAASAAAATSAYDAFTRPKDANGVLVGVQLDVAMATAVN